MATVSQHPLRVLVHFLILTFTPGCHVNGLSALGWEWAEGPSCESLGLERASRAQAQVTGGWFLRRPEGLGPSRIAAVRKAPAAARPGFRAHQNGFPPSCVTKLLRLVRSDPVAVRKAESIFGYLFVTGPPVPMVFLR
jgi:hypothetical protein